MNRKTFTARLNFIFLLNNLKKIWVKDKHLRPNRVK